jgi:uncharacterized protein (TIGR02246 family)
MKKIVVGLVMLAMTVTNPAIANTADDEQAVRKVIADYGDAWNKHDPDAILALFTDDADWVNVAGSWWHGQAEHRRGTTWVHAHVFKNAHGHIGAVVVRFSTKDTAVAIFTHDVENFVLPDGTRNPGGTTGCHSFWSSTKGAG